MPRKWLNKKLPRKEHLRDTFVYRLLGERILEHDLWHINRKSLSGGMAIGLFLAFTPTIPFHMILAAVGAIIFRVNLPVAVIVCWINNPFTALFIYSADYHLGRFFLKDLEMLGAFHSFSGSWKTVMEKTSYLWTGALILGSLSALTGSLSVRFGWLYITVKKWKQRKKS